MHSTLTNLIKTSIAENKKQWDENLKYINFVINTTTNQTTGYSPFEMTFGRNPNIPSTLSLPTELTYDSLLSRWKRRHEENIKKTKERIHMEMEKTKKRIDDKIIRKHPVYEI